METAAKLNPMSKEPVVSAHQPHFFPWLGYFDKMMRADVFVLVDHVQYERRNFQNRNRIKTPQGVQWLMVPVRQRSRGERIFEKEINTNRDGRTTWNEKILRTLECAYGKARYFDRYAGDLKAIFEKDWKLLVDLDEAVIRYFMTQLEITTPLVRSSTLPVSGAKSEMIVSMCQAVGARTYLSGSGGSRKYLDLELFHDAGLDVAWQEFDHPIYAQQQRSPLDQFVPRLSVVDLLFTCGPESAAILRKGGRISYEPIDAPEGDEEMLDEMVCA